MCVPALCTRAWAWVWDGSELGGQTGSGLCENVTSTPLFNALWHPHRVPPATTAINGVVAWTQLPRSPPPFASFLPRAPLLIWAHLPPQGRQIKFLFERRSGGVGGKQTGSGRATLTFLSACQEQRLLARQHYFCPVCPQLRAGQPQRHPGGAGHLQHLRASLTWGAQVVSCMAAFVKSRPAALKSVSLSVEPLRESPRMCQAGQAEDREGWPVVLAFLKRQCPSLTLREIHRWVVFKVLQVIRMGTHSWELP